MTQCQPTALKRFEHHTTTHTSHARTRDSSRVARDLSHRVRFHVSLTKTVISHIKHSMPHASSVLFPSHFEHPLTFHSLHLHSFPSFYPSTRHPLTLSSHGDCTCGDPSNASFGPVPESTSPTGYGPRISLETTAWRSNRCFPQTEHDVDFRYS